MGRAKKKGALDDHKIVRVLNSSIKLDDLKYKNIEEIFIKNGKIHLERRDPVKFGYIPTKYKVPIHSYKAIYRMFLKSQKEIAV